MSWGRGLWWNVYCKHNGLCHWSYGNVSSVQVEISLLRVTWIGFCYQVFLILLFVCFSLKKLFNTRWRHIEVGWVSFSWKISSGIVKDGLKTSRYYHSKITTQCNGYCHGTGWVYQCSVTLDCYCKVNNKVSLRTNNCIICISIK